MMITGAPKFPELQMPDLTNISSIIELEERLNMPLKTASGKTISWLRCFVDACRNIKWNKSYSPEVAYMNNFCDGYASWLATFLESKGLKVHILEGSNAFYFLPLEIREYINGIYNSTRIIPPNEMMTIIKLSIRFEGHEVEMDHRLAKRIDEKQSDYEIVLKRIENPLFQDLVGYYGIDFMNTARIQPELGNHLERFHTVIAFKIDKPASGDDIGILDIAADQFIQLAEAYDKLRINSVGKGFVPNPIIEDKPWFFTYEQAIKQGLYLPFRKQNLEHRFQEISPKENLELVFNEMQEILKEL